MEELSKKDVLGYLWKNGLGDFASARRDAENLSSLKNVLNKTYHDSGYSRITRSATKLLLVNYLIGMETDSGNQNLSGNLASGLQDVILGCVAELKSTLSTAPAVEDESARPSRKSAVRA